MVMVKLTGSGALSLLASLLVGLLPVYVQPCGHHLVHRDLHALVALHTAHQSAGPRSGAWGNVLELGGPEEEAGSQPDSLAHVAGSDALHEHGHGDGHDHADCTGHDHGHNHGSDHGRDERRRASAAVAGLRSGGGATLGGVQRDDQARRGTGRAAEERRRLQQQSTPAPAPLRLSVTYQRMEALDASQQQMLTRVVEAVRRILRKFISVRRPPSGGLLADPYCMRYTSRGCLSYYPDFGSGTSGDAQCGLASLLPQHVVNPANCSGRASWQDVVALGSGAAGPASGAGAGASGYGTGCRSYAGTTGEATDMYLYITAVQNEDCAAGAAAWARPCLLDLGDNRPLVGAANVCPDALQLLDEAALTATMAHEMIHALGFTDAMYNLTRRADGTPRPLSEVVSTASVDGRSVMRLVTPAVRDAARAHFGCEALEGAQLEEDGNAGSAGSHWEYTHYQGEVMVASTVFAADGTPPALSNMTLSYLEDTGWYVANRSAAGLLAWGAGAGCALPGSSCRQYMRDVPGQRLFCDPTSQAAASSFSCSLNYKSTGVCRSMNFTGGCGLLLSYNADQTCIGPDAAYDMPDVFGWGTGSPSGRCLPVVYLFTAQLRNNRYTFPGNGNSGDVDAACFDTSCSADGSKVYVQMLGQKFECPAGQYLSLPALLPGRYTSGRIGPCPPASAICATQSCPASACNPAGGDCLNGKCYCRLAFTGPDCSYSLIAGQALPNAAAVNSSAAGNGSAGGATSPSPPPSNVWTQVVQLSLALFNPVPDVQARAAALAAALAGWADLDVSAVRIALVAAADGNTTGQGGAGGGIEPLLSGLEENDGASSSVAASSQIGQAYDATAGNAGTRRRGLRGQQQALQQPLQHRAGLQAAAAASPPPPSPSTSVIAMLTAGGARATTILVGRLRDGTQLKQLYAALASANFSAQTGSVAFQTVITMVTVQAPPPLAPGAVASVTPSAAAEGSNPRMVIVIAIAAGATAVAGILVAVVAVLLLRARRSSREQAALAAKRARAYHVHINGVSSDGGGTGLPAALGAQGYGGRDLLPLGAAPAALGMSAGPGMGPGGPPVTVHAYVTPGAGPDPYGGQGAYGGQGPRAYGPPHGPAPSPLYSGPTYGGC